MSSNLGKGLTRHRRRHRGAGSAAREAIGLDPETLRQSLGDRAGFVEGASESSLGGALVVATKDAAEAKSMVADVGLLLRATEAPGVTAISGNVSGFSVRVPDLGPKPLVVGAAGERIVIAHGLRAAAQALRARRRRSARRRAAKPPSPPSSRPR